MTEAGWKVFQARGVILDLDGLLVDSEPIHRRAFVEVLAHHGIHHEFDDEEYGQNFVGFPVRANIEWLVKNFPLKCSVGKLLEEREAIYEGLLRDPKNLVPMPGMSVLIDGLEKLKLPMAVASSSPRGQVETILGGLGIANRMSAVVAGTDVPKIKPAPDVYLKAVRDLGLGSDECVAVEDSETGVIAAKASGLRVIAVPSRFTRGQNLRLADAQAANLAQVLDLIDGRANS